jgi:hypothetical protein
MQARVLQIAFFTVGMVWMSTGCQKAAVESSQPLELRATSAGVLPGVTDWASLRSYVVQEGYVGSLSGNERVYYSASYGDGQGSADEAGQAYGHLVAEAGRNGRQRFMFVQDEMVTTQALFPPGLGGFEGKSRWDVGRFVELAQSVALGEGRNGPDYPNMRAEKVSVQGGTAGGSVGYDDAIKVSLSGAWGGGKTNTIIIFAKGLGPRIIEFRETNMPSGTAKVYIDSNTSDRRSGAAAGSNRGNRRMSSQDAPVY